MLKGYKMVDTLKEFREHMLSAARLLNDPFKDRAIFMGIRDREICTGTTGYLGPSVERGHRLF